MDPYVLVARAKEVVVDLRYNLSGLMDDIPSHKMALAEARRLIETIEEADRFLAQMRDWEAEMEKRRIIRDFVTPNYQRRLRQLILEECGLEDFTDEEILEIGFQTYKAGAVYAESLTAKHLEGVQVPLSKLRARSPAGS